MIKLYQNNLGKVFLVSIVAAFIFGIFAPHIFAHLEFISNTFVNLLKLCALPIVFTSLIITIGDMEQLHQLKSVVRNSLFYILISEIVAVTIGLVLFNAVDVSKGVDGHALLSGVTHVGETSSNIDPSAIFNYLFTANIFHSLVNFDVLPIVIFSIIFGITCALNQSAAQPVLNLCKSTRTLFLSMLNGVMYLAAPAIFVMIGSAVAESYLGGAFTQNILGLIKFVGLFFVGLFLHFLWQTILVIVLYKNIGVNNLVGKSGKIFSIAFISSSSLATLPLAIKRAEELGAKGKVINFMLPVCASMNFASGMMYEIAACLFFMQILGIHPDITHQILLAIACIVTGIAVGGIPETSMVSFVAVFNMAGIPLSALSILMPLDRVVDRIRTMVNIFVNMCGTLIVSKFTKD